MALAVEDIDKVALERLEARAAAYRRPVDEQVRTIIRVSVVKCHLV